MPLDIGTSLRSGTRFGPRQIRVCCVVPGAVPTELNIRAGFGTHEDAAERYGRLAPSHVLGRVGTPGQTAFGRPDLDAFFDHTDAVVGVSLDQRVTPAVRQRASYSLASTVQTSTNLAVDPSYTPRYGARVAQTLVVRFADGSTETAQWDADERWHKFVWTKPARAVSPECESDRLRLHPDGAARAFGRTHAAALAVLVVEIGRAHV